MTAHPFYPPTYKLHNYLCPFANFFANIFAYTINYLNTLSFFVWRTPLKIFVEEGYKTSFPPQKKYVYTFPGPEEIPIVNEIQY